MQLTILRCGEEADFSFCKRLWELSLHQVGARQDGDELPDQRGDDGGDGDGVDGGDDGEDGDGGDGGDHLGEQGGEDQPEEFVEEFQFRSPLGWFVGNCSEDRKMSNSTINNKPSIHIEDEKSAKEESKEECYTGKERWPL